MESITINFSDPKSIAAALASGLTTPELIVDFIDGAEICDGYLVLHPGVWCASDGHGEMIEGEYDNGRELAQAYVDDADWGKINGTEWINVRVWRQGMDSDGDEVRVDEARHKISLQQPEPECTHEDGHDWQSPHKIVGGIKENPGVWGHGGGVVITEVCMHCGCKKTTDTWAQDRNDGTQGLRSISYEAGKYADAVAGIEAE